MIERVVELKTNEHLFMVILSSAMGEVAEFMPYNVDPNENGGKNSSFKFWRAVSRMGYPDAEYWAMPKEERPEYAWDPIPCMEEIQKRRVEVVVRVEEQWNRKQGKMRGAVEELYTNGTEPVELNDNGFAPLATTAPPPEAEEPEVHVPEGEVPF